MECPLIDRKTKYKSELNKPINIRDLGFKDDYIFYEHSDPDGNKSKVQFCSLCGRKKDIFECYNESEWKHCPYYKSEKKVIRFKIK